APGGWGLAALHEKERSVSLWDLLTGTRTTAFPVGRRQATLQLSPDGRFLGTYWVERGQGAVEVFSTATGRRRTRLPVTGQPFAFGPDGTLYGLTRAGPARCRFPGERGVALDSGTAASLAVSADGRVAVVSRGPSEVRLLDGTSGSELARHPLPGRAYSYP